MRPFEVLNPLNNLFTFRYLFSKSEMAPNSDTNPEAPTVQTRIRKIDIQDFFTGEMVDIVTAAGHTLSHRVFKNVLLHFCRATYIEKCLCTRLNDVSCLVLPEGSCEARGIKIVLAWMYEACDMNNQTSLHGFKAPTGDLFAAINAERALDALGLDTDARITREFIYWEYFSRSLRVEEIEDLWTKLPRGSHWITAMQLNIQKTLSNFYIDEILRVRTRDYILSDPKLESLIKPGEPFHPTTFRANRAIENWILRLDTDIFPKMPTEEELVGDCEYEIPVLRYIDTSRLIPYSLVWRDGMYHERGTIRVQKKKLSLSEQMATITPMGKAWQTTRLGS